MTAADLGPYLLACVLLTVAPGPDNVLVVSLGLARGRRPAVLAAWGMVSGVLVHTTAAALGISAVLAASPLAFRAVQFGGAAYLVYLAWRMLRERGRGPDARADRAPIGGWALYRRGFLMNVLNPKVALFFLAFLPQFVRRDGATPVWLQMITLGLLFMAQAFVIFTMFGLFAGVLGDTIARRPWIQRLFDWLAAGVFFALAIGLAAGR
ncbi:MAG TPA: LysE family translocator [Candidatus Krumholzibacteria bacterium]|nr:LysE family translocator [Candidatus Krumholzibacteria bacterium]HPD70399.1 LysE family translocator [Candidatus Krumholzibacteria bacterium]HRY39901.1 LysE family translocator [Candidatus Krumholzibacteria bacterium]